MAEEQENYYSQNASPTIKIRDIEEKQRILKDRVLLTGRNLIDNKEKTEEKINEIKKDMEIMKQKLERMVSFIETLSGEISNFAKKEDVEILAKQARMFQP